MASSEYTIFDKLCDNLRNSMTMEKILEFALLGRIIVSYEIDNLKSFHDRFFQGLWEKSPNGCFYPLDDGHQKVAYVVVNVNFEVECAKSMEKLRNFSVAHKVFDEMSEPVSRSNLSQHVSFTDDNTITCGNIEMKSDGVDEFSVSKINGQDVDEKGLIDNGCTQGYDAYVKEAGVDSVVGDSGLVRNLQQAIDSAHNMFDKMPIPTFMLEMAQSAKTTQGEPFEVDHDHELESHEVSEIHVASLEYKRRMLAKLGSLDGLCFRVLVSIGASRERFCLLLGLLFDQCQSLDDVYEQCDKISYPKHPRFQKVLTEISKPKHKSASPLVLSLEPKNVITLTPFQVTISTFPFVDVENEVLWWVENCMSSECVVWKTMSDSIYYHIIFDPGISFLFINNAEICPYTKFYELRNGCESDISYKEALSWGNPSQCCEFAMTSSFRALNSDYYVGSEMILLPSKCWKLFVFHLSSSLGEEMVNGTYALNMPWVFISFNPSYLETSSIFFTYTLEDKGDFRGVEDTSEKCTQKLLNPLVLWCDYFISWTKKVVGCLAYIFEMGSVGHLPLVVTRSTWRLMCTEAGFVPSERSTSSSLLNHNFDPGGKCSEARLLIYGAVISNFHRGGFECRTERVMALFNCGLMICSEYDANNVDIELAVTRIIDLCWFCFQDTTYANQNDYSCGIKQWLLIALRGIGGISISGHIEDASTVSARGKCELIFEVQRIIGYMIKHLNAYHFETQASSPISMKVLKHINYFGAILPLYHDFGLVFMLVFEPGGVVGMCNVMFSSFKRVIVKWAYTLNSTYVFDPGGNNELQAVTSAIFVGDLYSSGLRGDDLTFVHREKEVQSNDTIPVFDPGGLVLDQVVGLLTCYLRNVLVSIIGALHLKLFMCANFDP